MHKKIYYIILVFIFISNCQLKKNTNSHGINFLSNRHLILEVEKTNKNDVIKILGRPHTTSLINEDKRWTYFERRIEKGDLLKLGQNVLIDNNILILQFDKYGVLKEKNFFTKEDMKKIKYSKKETENTITKKSFVNSLLQSVKKRMYSQKSKPK